MRWNEFQFYQMPGDKSKCDYMRPNDIYREVKHMLLIF